MKFYWSSETGGFYDSRINDELPAGSIEITCEYRDFLIKGTLEDRVVVADAKGYPVLQDSPPPTTEQAATAERAWRDEALERINWLRDRHRDEVDLDLPTTLEVNQFVQLLGHIQALRDWPQSSGFPARELRPVEPVWLIEKVK